MNKPRVTYKDADGRRRTKAVRTSVFSEPKQVIHDFLEQMKLPADTYIYSVTTGPNVCHVRNTAAGFDKEPLYTCERLYYVYMVTRGKSGNETLWYKRSKTVSGFNTDKSICYRFTRDSALRIACELSHAHQERVDNGSVRFGIVEATD